MVGALPLWLSPDERLEAMELFERDALAASTREAVAAKLRTIQRALEPWGVRPYPPSLFALRALGATLKRGGYRSAASYLWIYKADSQRRGFNWTDTLQRCLRDGIRSCERGMGPAVVAQALPLLELQFLPDGLAPWVRGGPAAPKNMLIVGAWWLMREIEVATVRAAHVSFSGSWQYSGGGVRITLPASKNDQAALGASRAHTCRCEGDVSGNCPVHTVLDQWFWLRRTFPHRFTNGRPDLDLPLFPTPRGEVVQKAAMVSTIIHGARLLGVQDSADGSERVTGHSLRPTGAQGLIALGWRQDAVKLMGRWDSEAVRRYTRDAALYAPSDLAALIVRLCGVPASAVPEPPTTLPEPPAPSADEWVLNSATDKYHLVACSERARCGWAYSGRGVRGSPPPPGFWHVCSTCAPDLRRRLKEQARAAGEYVRGRSYPSE